MPVSKAPLWHFVSMKNPWPRPRYQRGAAWVLVAVVFVASLQCFASAKDNSSLEADGDETAQIVQLQYGRSSVPSRSLLFAAGVTDADQSPSLPKPMVKAERQLTKHLKKLDTSLQEQADHESAIDLAEKKLQESITDDITSVAAEVQQMNKRDTDGIDNVEPIVGAPGPPGLHGSNGRDGKVGLTGPTGMQGRPGPRGAAGDRGLPGKDGPQGPVGSLGVAGVTGKRGPEGMEGQQGREGFDGFNSHWTHSKYMCPEAGTETMRLADCSTHGCRIETKFEDEWGSVCSRGFSDITASHVCRMLGFHHGGKAVPNVGGGKNMVWLSDLKCSGNEGDVGDCKHREWGDNDCTHGEDAGVCCWGLDTAAKGIRKGPSFFKRCPSAASPESAVEEEEEEEEAIASGASEDLSQLKMPTPPKNRMRLVDCSRFACRLEVLHDEKWGTVCEKGFSDGSAEMVCKALGFAAGGEGKVGCALQTKYGNCAENSQGEGPIWLSNVKCFGFERDLDGCRHLPWGSAPCQHSEDIGVCCQGRKGKPPTYKAPKSETGRVSWNLGKTPEGGSFPAPSSGGPPLYLPWGGGRSRPLTGYHFSRGKGLAVDQGKSANPYEYTIYMKVRFSHVNGWRKVISSRGWGYNGLYLNGNLQISPDADIECIEPIIPKVWYQILLSRDKQGLVRLYLNGYLCGVGKPEEANGYTLNPHSVFFFHGDGQKKQADGDIKKLKIYNRTLTTSEIRDAARCEANQRAKGCDNLISFSTSAPRTIYSSVWGGDKPGSGFGRGRLNSKAAWCAASSHVGEWMQMDTGSLQSIVGVVTQGRRDANNWVTGFKVQVSKDGMAWEDAFCGRYFTGNKNRNGKVKTIFPYPLYARHVRVQPYSWYGGLCMRAGVIICERPCIKGELSYNFRMDFLSSTFGPAMDPAWGEGDFETMRGPYIFAAQQGLLLDRSRCVGGAAWTIVIHALLDKTKGWRRILNSKGWGDTGLYVNHKYQMFPTASFIACNEQILPNTYYQFGISRTAAGLIKLYINGEVCSQGSPDISNKFALDPKEVEFFHDDGHENTGGKIKSIRLWNSALSDEEVAVKCDCRLATKGKTCQNLIKYSPPYQKTLYSSIYADDKPGTGHGRGRLNSRQAWSAKFNNKEQYVVMDTGEIQSIAGVVTQGRRGYNQWVTSFKVQVSDDGDSWRMIHCGRIFQGNTDQNTKVKTKFDYPVRSRFVKIEPQSWVGHLSMRAGVLICERPCENGELDFSFGMSFLSLTKGPPLDPAWGEGEFLSPHGPYRFKAGQGLMVQHIRCLKDDAYSLLMEVTLNDVKGWRRIMSSYGWDDNGLYVNSQLQLFPKSSGVRCEETLRRGKMYKIGMTRTAAGVVSLYLHGGQCASGSPLFSDKFHLSNKWVSFFRDDGTENSGGTVKRIRMWNRALNEVEMATLSGCTLAKPGKKCSLNIMISPPDYKLQYSSVWNNDPLGKGHARGRLRSKQAWSSRKNKIGQWMQIDSGEVQSIAGVVTQGRRGSNQRVTSFKVEVSEDGGLWIEVECGRIFKGNEDSNSKLKTKFKKPVRARFVRIFPQTWNAHMSMRAAVLACERPCQGGKLDYTFKQDMLISKSKGPSLEALWGEGFFDAQRGYHFAKGEGLAVVQSRCLKTAAYTIYIKAAIDSVSGWRRLVQSDGWGDAGFYVNKVFQTFPVASGIKCGEEIRPGVEYQYVITRSASGDIKIFLNGWLCGKGRPPYGGRYALAPEGTWFFRDDGSENTGGFVKRIMMWNKELTESQVREQCACALPNAGAACKHQVTINAPYLNHQYSSVWAGQSPGVGHARGRLNSRQAWSAARSAVGQYMTVDTGEVQSIAGVRTQGRRDSNQWVTSYKVMVSDDGANFKAVECGRTFDGNSNRNTKVKNIFSKPVRARYIRIFPQSWRNWMSMRAAPLVCERPCQGSRLDYRFRGSFMSKTKGPALEDRWGEGEFDAIRGYRFPKGYGFFLAQARCLKKDAYTVYIRATLDQTSGYRRIMGSEGWVDHGFYVNKHFMSYPSAGGLWCAERVRPGQEYKYVISRDTKGVVSIYLNGYPCGSKKLPYDEGYKLAPEGMTLFKDDGTENTAGWVKRIRLWGEALPQKKISAMCGCVLPSKGKACERQIVMTPFKNKVVYSGSHPSRYCNEGRLNSKDAWCANPPNKNAFMQMDSGEIASIAGVIVQGRRRANQWVTTLKVQVSDDGKEWLPVECGRQFDASRDRDTKTRILFEHPIRARFVRIFPQTWHGWPSMRAGILMCERPCLQAVLEYNFADSFSSSTRGPSLEAPRGEGYFDSNKGYHFNKGQGLSLDEWSCVNKTAYTVYMNVRLDQTSGYRRLLNSNGWGDAGLYVNGKVATFPKGGRLECDQSIAPGKNYQYVFSRGSDGTNKLYLNGYLCGMAKLPYKKGYSLAPHHMSFMQDDGKEDASGWLRKIKIWNKQLSDKEAAAECGCALTEKGKECEQHVVVSPPDKKYKYSSTWANDRNGYRHGRGRLNSRQAWSAGRNSVGQYLQIDTGSVQDIQGVETQGRYRVNQWVTGYILEVSKDGSSWMQVECGRPFTANRDQSTRAKNIFRVPVKARYVRFVVQSWYNHISMRAAVLVCEKKCKNGVLDYPMDGTLSSSTFGPMLTYDSMGSFMTHHSNKMMYRFSKNEGLTLDEGRCVTSSEWTILVYAKIDQTTGKRQVIGSSAWGNDGLYVDTILRMVPATTKMQCQDDIDSGKWYVYGLTRTNEGKMSLYLNGYLCATSAPKERGGFKLADHDVTFFNNKKGANTAGYIRNIKVVKKAMNRGEMASEAFCSVAEVSTAKCRGLITLNPPYSKHSYSSLYANYAPGVIWSRGRLNSRYCWYPAVARRPSDEPPYEGGNWMQIDTGEVQGIAGVATQGRPGVAQWVTYVAVKVSDDGSSWKHVACGRSFKANTDYSSTAEITFPEPVKGRYVRIYPQKWHGWPAIRAGVLVCEKKCKHGSLDFEFQQEFISYTDGPQLTTPWGIGTFVEGKHHGTRLGNGEIPTGWRYVVRKGQGLHLDEVDCIKPDKWTVIVHAKLDVVNHLVQIMGSKAWGDDGLYAKNIYRFMPQETHLKCRELLRSNVYYQFGLSRAGDGTVAIYLNGYKCAEGKPIFKKKYLLDPDDVVFFHNKHSSKNTGASIKQIRLWDKALSDSEMAQQNGCNLPDAASGDCKGLIVSNVPYSRHRYSSTWSNYPPGTYWGQGRLDARYGWLPRSAATGLEKGEWMQMDLGSAQNVAGLVTQGRNDAGWWTKAYSVKVSVDGDIWAPVACGMVFEANTDYRSKVTNKFPEVIKARYIRIYPIYYHGHPAIRAGVVVCERQCDNGYLNYDLNQEYTSSSGGPMLQQPWGTGRFHSGAKTQSRGNGHQVGSDSRDQRYQVTNGNGFKLEEGRCVKGSTFTVIIRGRLNRVSGFYQIFGTDSWDEDGLYVNKIFRMQPSTLGMKCQETIIARRWYDFGLTRDDKGKLGLYLNGFRCATATSKDRGGYKLGDTVSFYRAGGAGKQPSGAIQRIRMWDKALGESDMAKASHCSLPEQGKACRGIIAANPDYRHHRYSSVWGNYRAGQVYGQGQLGSRRAWLSASSRTGFDNGCWMQLDLGKSLDVAGLVTQGRGDGGWWVKGYAVRVSDDGEAWKEVACGRIFDANTDMNTKVKNLFPEPVKARYVRIYPMVYHGHPSMRAGVLLCEKKCQKGHLDYNMKALQLTSASDGPMLTAPWGEGRFHIHKHTTFFRIHQGQGFVLDASNCIGASKWTILMTVKLNRIHSWRQLVGSQSWGSDGLFSNRVLRWNPDVDGLACNSLLQTNKWYDVGLTRASDSTIAIYLNGYKCAVGKSKNKDGYKLDNENIRLLRGDLPSTSPSGEVQRIQLWDTVKGPTEMAELAGCKLPAESDKSCKVTIIYNPPYSKHRYSKVWANDKVGYRYGRGRLDSHEAFIPPTATAGYDSGEWMQMDSGEKQSIAGVVIQGRRNANQFMRTMLVRVSDDGTKWADVECGRAFEANVNHHEKRSVFFSNPVVARYVRIYVDTYTGWPSFRAGLILCAKDCKNKHLDYHLHGDYTSATNGPMLVAKWGAGRYQTDRGMYFDNGKGLWLDESSCISNKEAYTIVLEARMQWNTGNRQVFGSKAWGTDGGVAVDSGRYGLIPATAEVECNWKIFNNLYYNFGITRDTKGEVALYLNGMKCASGKPKNKNGYKIDPTELTFMHARSTSFSSPSWMKRLRIWGKALDEEAMAEIAGCKLGTYSEASCDSPGVYNVRYGGHRYNSVWANQAVGVGHGRGRLDSPQGWSSRSYGKGYTGNNWMQLDAGSVKSIAGVVTQGRTGHGQWVTAYKVKASDDEKAWVEVDCGRTFVGNSDHNTKVFGRFTRPISARYIRIYVSAWRHHPSMRAGLLLCDASYAQRKPSSWAMRVYKANSYMWDQPDESTLTYVGKGTPQYIDFKNAGDIRKYVKGVPAENFAAIVQGHVQILKEGEYTICAQSSDGSTVKIDGNNLIENEGTHDVVEKCKKIKLKPGLHEMKLDYFQNDGKIDLEATYRGPDTDDRKVSLPSDDFTMKVYASKDPIIKKPDISTLTPVGEKVSIPEINFRSLAEMKKYVPDAPNEYFALDFYGTFEIDMPGNYYFCTISDDGSRLWIDDTTSVVKGGLAQGSRPLIDNGGNHGNRRYCAWKKLARGKHTVHGDYFQGGGGMNMQVTYRGPDTDDKDELMRSEGGTLPKQLPESQWEMRLFQKDSFIGHRMPNVGTLKFVGTRVVPAIDFNELSELQRYYPQLKTADNTAIQWYGELTIHKPGHYLFCTESDDGSHLWFNGQMVVNNGGSHGNRQYCYWKHHIQPGTYPMKVDWFNGVGGWNIKVSYQGPDTGNERVLLGSKSAKGPPAPYESEWQMRIFKTLSHQTTMPDPATMQPVGDAVVPYIDFKHLNHFRKYVPSIPNTNVVAKIEGSFDIGTSGTYEICVESAYGSHVWIDGNMLLSHGGVHGRSKKCSSIVLEKGNVPIEADFFTSYYGVLIVTISGPNTGQIKNLGASGCTSSAPCAACAGDCDSDRDCAGNLKCFQRNTNGPGPPGCAASGIYNDYDYCYDPDLQAKPIMSKDLHMQVYADSSTLRRIPAKLDGLQKIGKREKITAINFHNLNAFREIVPGVPHHRYSVVFTGMIEIRRPGTYTFCTRSGDGSILSLSEPKKEMEIILDNGGLHGVRTRCGSKTLKKGEYNVQAEYFQSSGGGYMVVTYQGPDTWGIKELLPSKEALDFKRTEVSQWTMRLFSSPTNRGTLQRMPNFAWLNFLGEATVPAIDFSNVPELRRYVPNVPYSNIAGAWFGKTVIVKPGDYHFCTSSDDGSFLWLDDVLVVNNGGAHGNVRKCGLVKGVKKGTHSVKVTWWQGGGGMRVKATYIGADSRGKERLLASTVKWAPARVKKSVWNVKVYKIRGRNWANLDAAALGRKWKMEIYRNFAGHIHRLPVVDSGKNGATLISNTWLNTHVVGGEWKGEFYKWDSSLSKIPSLDGRTPTKIVKTKEINYWDHQFAVLGFHDRFVVRWTGKVDVQSEGTYFFRACSDDGSQVWLGDSLVVDNDGLHGRTCREGSIKLKAGKHDIKVMFFENGGGANCQIQWMVKAASTSPAQRPQPGISLQPWKVVESSGIKHWDHDFARLGVNDLFFARWTVPWKVKGTGKYRFHLCSDDGSDLIITDSRGKVVEGIDGQKSSGKIINNDGLHGRRCYTGSAALKDGETYVLEVNFFENHGGANCQLDFTYEPTALPELEAGELMGEGTFPYIELKRNHDLRVIVPQTPHYNYMWRYTGQVVIREAGKYIFCDSSDDGYASSSFPRSNTLQRNCVCVRVLDTRDQAGYWLLLTQRARCVSSRLILCYVSVSVSVHSVCVCVLCSTVCRSKIWFDDKLQIDNDGRHRSSREFCIFP